MKLSLNWIQDFIDLPVGTQNESSCIQLSKLVYDLTMSTVEVEEARDLAREFDNMVVGVVRNVGTHPNADKLVLCQVDIGDSELREIVCGGTNVVEGMKVAVARPGAMVRWHGEGDLIELKKAKVRGIESYGMICSSSEIGLFDLFPFTDDTTIMDISGFDAPAGTPLAEALGLNDIILTIDNKSLTNRPDLWGHYGIARELAAIYDLPLKEISPAGSLELAMSASVKSSNLNPAFSIQISDPELCPRYIGVKIEGVSLIPAPFEIQSRIWRVGMRPINAIVDITNYIMLETGSPTHAFDADNVHGNINIRRAEKDEKLLLLDGKDLTLSTGDLVIADEKEAIALAGIMGGEKDSILPDTTNVILEIANFNALSVRRTSMRHDVRTEAATRFEKGIDPQRADLTLSAALRLFTKLFPEMKITGFCDNYPLPLTCNEVNVSLNWLEKRLGQKLPDDRITAILKRLGFDTTINGDTMNVTVPSWRSTGDVSIPDDIMEEIARIHGLENFQPTPIITAFEGAINQPEIDIDRRIREYLARTCAMNEVFTYPWISEEYVTAVSGSTAGMPEMSSPPSPGERYLRKSLIPGLCKAVSDNLRYFSEFAIFESAQVFSCEKYSSLYDEREMLPLQRRHIAGAYVAPREQYADIYRLAKGMLETMPRAVHIQPLMFTAENKPYWADDVIWQNIYCEDNYIGVFGLLSQKAALACGIKNSSVMLFELDIDALDLLKSRENTYMFLPEYPMNRYDVSLLFDTKVKWEEIRSAALGKASHENLLRSVSFIEEYKGNKIPSGKKSVTIRLTIGSLKKTLTSNEIESCAASVIKRLHKTLGGETRA